MSRKGSAGEFKKSESELKKSAKCKSGDTKNEKIYE